MEAILFSSFILYITFHVFDIIYNLRTKNQSVVIYLFHLNKLNSVILNHNNLLLKNIIDLNLIIQCSIKQITSGNIGK